MDKKFMCTQCDKKFFTRKDLKRHSVVHTGNREFCCPHCSQRFGRKVRIRWCDEFKNLTIILFYHVLSSSYLGSHDQTRKEDTPQLLSRGCLSWGKGWKDKVRTNAQIIIGHLWFRFMLDSWFVSNNVIILQVCFYTRTGARKASKDPEEGKVNIRSRTSEDPQSQEDC